MGKKDLRLDAYEKVTGRAVYTDDITLDDMLYVCEVHCPYAHARIDDIDTSRAIQMPGVVCVLTGRDLADHPLPLEKPILAKTEVLCADEAVALVAAETDRQARAAAKAVRVDYTVLPAVCSIDEATAPDAVLVHPGGNIACECVLEKGRPGDFDSCEVVVEQTFRTQRMHHGAVEPDCVVAKPKNDGITIFCGSKGAYNVRKELSALLMLPAEKIQVKHMAIGGGFGGKMCDTVVLAARASVMALKTSRPCKALWSREESLSEGTKRHPFQVTVKLGATADGTITSASLTGYADGGAYLMHTKGVVFRAMTECLGPYKIDHAYVNIKGVYTHTVPSDAVRGFGTPQVAFAMESAVDMLAHKLGMSPYALRKKNLLHDGDTHASGQTAERVGIQQCAEELKKLFDVDAPAARREGTKAYGRGLAYVFRGESHGGLCNGNDICGVDIDILDDGTLRLSTSVSEVGQGAYTAEAMALAELLDIPVSRICVRGADTACTPPCTTTSGSRGTISGVNAVWLAYLDMTERLAGTWAERLGVEKSTVQYRNRKFYANHGQISITLDEAVELYRAAGHYAHFEGRWVGPHTGWDWERHTGTPYYSYAYGVCGAEVEVDLVSGRIRISDLVTINDLGRIVNYEEAKAQIAGGLMMSVGYALKEESAIQDGVIASRNFDKYIMPMARDMVHIRPIPAELVPAANPMGVHGVGELSASIAAPAIANAVSNALGVRITALPMSLERVREAIDSRKECME